MLQKKGERKGAGFFCTVNGQGKKRGFAGKWGGAAHPCCTFVCSSTHSVAPPPPRFPFSFAEKYVLSTHGRRRKQRVEKSRKPGDGGSIPHPHSPAFSRIFGEFYLHGLLLLRGREGKKGWAEEKTLSVPLLCVRRRQCII